MDRKVLTWLFGLYLSFWYFNVSMGVAAEEEKRKKKRRKNGIGRNHRHSAPLNSNPVTPIHTRYGTQYNLVTEEQIKQQNSYDFQSTLRNVPGVMFQSKNLIGSSDQPQPLHSWPGRQPSQLRFLLFCLTEFPALEHYSARCWVTVSPFPPSGG